MKKVCCTALLALLLLGGCIDSSGQEARYQVYYRSTSGSEEHSSLASLGFTPDITENDIAALIAELFAAPAGADLRSPFPSGTKAQRVELIEQILYLDLSEQYESLSGFGLTLADACITLTLCQLENVDGVSITVNGSADRLGRSNEILTPELYLLEEYIIDSEAESQ